MATASLNEFFWWTCRAKKKIAFRSTNVWIKYLREMSLFCAKSTIIFFLFFDPRKQFRSVSGFSVECNLHEWIGRQIEIIFFLFCFAHINFTSLRSVSHIFTNTCERNLLWFQSNAEHNTKRLFFFTLSICQQFNATREEKKTQNLINGIHIYERCLSTAYHTDNILFFYW